MKKNTLWSKLSYASGDIYGGGSFLIFSILYMNFLVLVEGIPVLATTLIILLGKLWDAITDPIMGRLSDKTKSRFGRRRIYFLIGIVPVFLSFFMLFYSFGIKTITAKIVYYVFAYMFFGTCFTLVMIPYNAILSDMTNDYNERISYTTVRMCFSGGASLICAVVPSMLIDGIGGASIGPNQTKGYLVMGLVFGVLFGISWLFAFLGTREREELFEEKKVSLKDWLSVFKLKPYRNFLGIFLFFQVCIDLVLALFIFYIDIVILKYKSYSLIMASLLLSQLISMVINGEIAKRKGKVFPMVIGLPIWIIIMIIMSFVTPATPVWLICIFTILIGYGASAGNLATWALLSDIYDIDECVTSQRREGVYSGITTFLRKFASGISIFILGIALTAIGLDQNKYNLLKSLTDDFDPSSYAKASIVIGIKWIFIILPILLLGICLIFALLNKINKKRFDVVIKALDTRKKQGNLSTLTDEELIDLEVITGVKRERLFLDKR